MRKLNKFLLGGLVCAVSFIFMNNVKAEGIKYRYPVYGNGTIISYDKKTNMECVGCDKYVVSQDDGEEDSDILLTKEDNTESFILSKVSLSKVSVLLSTEPLDLNFDGKSVNGENPEDMKSVKEIIYHNSTRLKDILNEEEQFEKKYGYANILFPFPETAKGNNVTIPKNVTLTSEIIVGWENFVNNGIVKTYRLHADKISGNGVINLMDSTKSGWDITYRLSFNEISGVKVNAVTNGDLEGLLLASLGRVSKTTKEEAQRKLDELNKVKGNSLNGYDIELGTTYDNSNSTEVYTGVLKKTKVNELENNDSEKQENEQESKKENSKKEIKNPSTGDNTDLTAIIIIVSGVLAAITFKKVKQK